MVRDFLNGGTSMLIDAICESWCDLQTWWTKEKKPLFRTNAIYQWPVPQVIDERAALSGEELTRLFFGAVNRIEWSIGSWFVTAVIIGNYRYQRESEGESLSQWEEEVCRFTPLVTILIGYAFGDWYGHLRAEEYLSRDREQR